MAKKKRKVKHSKLGKFVAQLIAKPGEEPVFDEEQAVPKIKKVKKPSVKVTELRAAAESINAAASTKLKKPVTSDDIERKEIDEEYKEEFSPALSEVKKHTESWKKTGNTGLYLEPKVTMRDRVDKIVSKYKKKMREADEKKWVSTDQLKPEKKSLLTLKFGHFFEKRKKEKRIAKITGPVKVDEVFEELMSRESVRKDDDIDKIYKQLKDK